MASSALADSIYDKLANLDTEGGRLARESFKYPPMLLELPHETAARVALLKWKDSCLAAKTWTPAMELQLAQGLAACAKAMNERLYPPPPVVVTQPVIIIDRR